MTEFFKKLKNGLKRMETFMTRVSQTPDYDKSQAYDLGQMHTMSSPGHPLDTILILDSDNQMVDWLTLNFLPHVARHSRKVINICNW